MLKTVHLDFALLLKKRVKCKYAIPFLCVLQRHLFGWRQGKRRPREFFRFSRSLVSFSTLQRHHPSWSGFCCSLVVTANQRGRARARAVSGSNPRHSRTDLTEGQNLCLISVGGWSEYFRLPSNCPRHFFPKFFFLPENLCLASTCKQEEVKSQCRFQLGSR